MRESDWVSAHIYYHDDLDTVLVHLVDPLRRSLVGDGLARAQFFVRDWDGGHHVRLRLLPAAGAYAEVRRRLEASATEFVRRRPARTTMAAPEYAQAAAEFARWEGRHDYRPRPYPNNSVMLVPYVAGGTGTVRWRPSTRSSSTSRSRARSPWR